MVNRRRFIAMPIFTLAVWAIVPGAARLATTVALRNFEREWGIHGSIARIGHAGALGLAFEDVEFAVAGTRVATIRRFAATPAIAWPPLVFEARGTSVSPAGVAAWRAELHRRGDAWNLGRIAMRRLSQAMGPFAWTLRVEEFAFEGNGTGSTGSVRLHCASETSLTVEYEFANASGSIAVEETRDSLTVRETGRREVAWRVSSPEWSSVVASGEIP